MTNPTKGTDPINPMTMEHFQLGLVGLTKREHFAAMAMQGFCSAYGVGKTQKENNKIEVDLSGLSEISVRLADALINALNKHKND